MKKIWCVMALLMLGGCLLPSNKETNFYYLKAMTISGTHEIALSKPVRIGVQRVEIPPYLDRPQIVTVGNDSVELIVSEWNRWGENLSTLLQRTISEDISLYAPNAFVKPLLSSQEEFDYTVLIEMNKLNAQFNSDEDGKVMLDAYWTVFNADGDTVFQQRTQMESGIKGSYEDLANRISSLVSDLSYQITREIQKISRK